MIKKYLKKKFYNKDLEFISDKTERFIVLMNDIKQVFGAWYTVAALKILPVILYIIPVNVVLARVNFFIMTRFSPDFYWDGPILMIMWALAMVAFILLAILSPKAATVFEFLFGFAYIFFVFKNHLFNTPVGITLLIVMTLFLLVKLFFLVLKIMSKIKFAGDAKGVERDESGRIVRAVGEDVFFLQGQDREKIDKNRPLATADNDFLFEKTAEVHPEINEARAAYDDDFFIGNVNSDTDSTARASYDDDFFFEKDGKSKNEKNVPVAGSDDDFFFG